MDNLAKLQQRKAALKAKIEQQQADIKKTLLEVRAEMEPAKLLKKAVSGAFSVSADKPADGKPALPAPISFLMDVLIKDPRLSFFLKLLAPLALRLMPGRKEKPAETTEGAVVELPADKSNAEPTTDKPTSEPTAGKPTKTNIYGRFRRGVASLRSKLHKTTPPENTPQTPEN